MNRRQWMKFSGAALASEAAAQTPQAQPSGSPAESQDTPDRFLLKDYKPESIYRIPQTSPPRPNTPSSTCIATASGRPWTWTAWSS